MSLLYLLVNKAGTAFKIGVSVNPVQRAGRLPEPINLRESIEVLMLDDADAFRAEKALHYLFRNSRFQMPHGEGYTEWFDIARMPQLLLFLQEHSAKFGFREIRPLNPKPIREKFSTEKVAAREASRQKRIALAAEHAVQLQQEAQRHNTNAVARTCRIISEIQGAGALAGALTIVRHRSKERWGVLFIQGDEKHCWAKTLVNPLDDDSYVRSGSGHSLIRIFGGYFVAYSYPVLAIEVGPEFLGNSQDHDIPNIEALQLLLHRLLAANGSAQKNALHQHMIVLGKQRKKLIEDLYTLSDVEP